MAPDSTPEFVEQLNKALAILDQLPTGRALLLELSHAPNQTLLEEYGGANGLAKFHLTGRRDASGRVGSGSDALVKWNPHFSPSGFPPELTLAHELIHSLHARTGRIAHGQVDDSDHPDHGINLEELVTIGTVGGGVISENALRRDWNRVFAPVVKIPPRRYYSDELMNFTLPPEVQNHRPGQGRRPRTGQRCGIVGRMRSSAGGK